MVGLQFKDRSEGLISRERAARGLRVWPGYDIEIEVIPLDAYMGGHKITVSRENHHDFKPYIVRMANTSIDRGFGSPEEAFAYCDGLMDMLAEGLTNLASPEK